MADKQITSRKEVVSSTWPKRVLITNDNGIDDIKLVELACAFAEVAETFVVAPLENRSGSTNYLSLGSRKPVVEVQKRDLGHGIIAYGLDGYPADCIFFGGFYLRDDPPDLVISGINGGPNLGREWFTSGTIGAARLAAYWGLPAIAVSGLDITIPGSITAVTKWIVKLAQSAPVRELRSGQFLTVSIPRVPPSKIRGLRIVHRAPPDVSSIPFLVPVKSEATSDGRQLWQLQRPSEKASESEGDVAAYEENFIAIVPMNVDENDYDLILELNKCLTDFPNWANTLPETD